MLSAFRARIHPMGPGSGSARIRPPRPGSPRVHPLVAGVAALALATAGLVGPMGTGIASAQISTPQILGPSVLSDAPEYFTDMWNDPLDMSNEADFDLTPGRRAVGVSVAMGGGRLDYTTQNGFGRLYFVSSEPTPMHAIGHREANDKPIDTSAMRRIGMRAHTDRDTVAYIVWNRCIGGEADPGCQGTKAIRLQQGWHTYDLDMTGASDLDSYTDPGLPNSVSGAGWVGAPVYQLSLQPSVSGTAGISGLIDFVRIYQPGVAVQSLTVPTGASEVWYDTDTDPSNNGTEQSQGESAGLLMKSSAGSAAVDLGRIPPAEYRLVAAAGTTRSAPSNAFRIDAAPRPVVVDPDMAGSGDWAAEVRGDAFDFSNASDIFRMFDGGPSNRNSDVAVTNGLLAMTSAGRWDDPQLYLTDAAWNNPVLDAEEWNRISWRMGYQGTWGTDPVAGEGLDMRFCWQSLAGAHSCSLDVFPKLGWTDYSVTLQTPDPAAIEAPGYSRIGFGGPNSRFVQLFRLDPHEDPGYRAWFLDYVRIGHNDRIPVNGTFAITFRDDAWESGTTAEVFVDAGPQAGLGDRIAAGLPVTQGDNVVRWAGAGYGPGEYTVRVRLTDPRGVQRWSESTGPVEIPDPNRWKPFGAFDTAVARGRSIYAAGWTADPDSVRSANSVHLYVDGVGYDLGPARAPRGDVGANRTDLGPYHGWSAEIPAGVGTHSVCAYGINIGHGSHTLLGCSNVVVK